MELRNPMKGIGFGWSLTGYARCRVVRTHPFRVSSLRTELSETKTQPCRLKMVSMGLWMASACFQKKYLWFRMVVISKLSPNPAVVCFSSPLLSRSGQAGLRVVTTTQWTITLELSFPFGVARGASRTNTCNLNKSQYNCITSNYKHGSNITICICNNITSSHPNSIMWMPRYNIIMLGWNNTNPNPVSPLML